MILVVLCTESLLILDKICYYLEFFGFKFLIKKEKRKYTANASHCSVWLTDFKKYF